MKEKSLNRELQNTINSLNQQIMHMKEIMVTTCTISMKDPNEKRIDVKNATNRRGR